MTARVWPVDAVTGAPSYTGRALRQTQVAPLVAGATAARPLGSLSGVRPGTSTTIATATSTTWTVTPFAGIIDGEALAIAGPYQYAFDANTTGSVTAAAGSARVDRLDVQVSDPAESDGSSVPSIAIVKNDGIPGTGVPVAAPARSHPLAYINVPLSGGGSPTVTWVAPYATAPGGLLYSNTFSQLPTTANLADKCQALDTGVVYRWNGSGWKAWESDWITYTPTLTNWVIGTGGTAALTGSYRYVGGRVRIKVTGIFGTSGASVTGNPAAISIPVNSVALRWSPEIINGSAGLHDVSAGIEYAAPIYQATSPGVGAVCVGTAGSLGAMGAVNSTTPFGAAWASGDSFYVEAEYDPA